MCDIISSVPWACGDPDCTSQWHLANYWSDGEGGYTVDSYSDGDHEACEYDEVPGYAEERAAWKAYHSYVANTGHDPLGDFPLPDQKVNRRKWQVKLRGWIGIREHGIMVVGVRRNGRGPWLNINDAPGEVAEYLTVEKTTSHNCTPIFRTTESVMAFVQVGDEVLDVRSGKDGIVIDFVVEEKPSAWSDTRRVAYLKRKASECLKEQDDKTI